MPKYTIVDSTGSLIALPPEIRRALGEPTEGQTEIVPEGLLVRLPAAGMRMGSAAGDVAAMKAFRARLPARDDLLTDEYWAELRQASKAAELREAEQVLADYQDGDVPA